MSLLESIKDFFQSALAAKGRTKGSRPEAVLVDKKANKSYSLSKAVCKLGRDVTNEVHIPDDSASRHHARIVFTNGIYTLEDLDSSNGTFLNGKYLKETTKISQGDRVRIGQTELTFELVPPGSLFRHYEFISEISKGEMATIYKAFDRRKRRMVAVKQLTLDDVEPQYHKMYRNRFRREATIASRLEHPNIVGVYDIQISEESSHYVMEYLEGFTLRKVLELKGGRLSAEEWEPILEQVAEGLDYAHSKNVVHRDIKPENIFVLSDGTVKVTDFGVAFTSDDAGETRLTSAGTLIGTISYCSPEQIQDAKGVDFRSDIFSLGVVTYEALSGELPFAGEGIVAVLTNIMSGKEKPLSVIAPGISPATTAVVSKALCKAPGERYGSVAEFARAFADAIAVVIKRDALRTQAVTPREGLPITKSAGQQALPISSQLLTPREGLPTTSAAQAAQSQATKEVAPQTGTTAPPAAAQAAPPAAAPRAAPTPAPVKAAAPPPGPAPTAGAPSMSPPTQAAAQSLPSTPAAAPAASTAPETARPGQQPGKPVPPVQARPATTTPPAESAASEKALYPESSTTPPVAEVTQAVPQQATGLAAASLNQQIPIAKRPGDITTNLILNPVSIIGQYGEGNGCFLEPSIVCARNGKVAVADAATSKIQVFSRAGKWLSTSSIAPGSEYSKTGGYLTQPSGLVIDSKMTIYASDDSDHVIRVYEITGSFFKEFVNEHGMLAGIAGIVASSSGLLYASDYENGCIQIFHAETGNWVGKIGSKGPECGQIRLPSAVGLDRDDSLYVLDYGNHRISIFSRKGEFLKQIEETEQTKGLFSIPQGLAIDPNGMVYVSDSRNHLIHVFEPSGKRLYCFGEEGSDAGQFNEPAGICLDGDEGRLYVADKGNHRVQVFDIYPR